MILELSVKIRLFVLFSINNQRSITIFFTKRSNNQLKGKTFEAILVSVVNFVLLLVSDALPHTLTYLSTGCLQILTEFLHYGIDDNCCPRCDLFFLESLLGLKSVG